MGEYFVKRPLKRPPVHPGEILREDVLPTLGLSVSEAARRLGISRQQLHRVLACTHPITTDMALRIGKFAGNGPGLWLRIRQALSAHKYGNNIFSCIYVLYCNVNQVLRL